MFGVLVRVARDAASDAAGALDQQHEQEQQTQQQIVVEKVSQTTFLAVAWTSTALALCFLAFRLPVRYRAFKKLQTEDYLVIFSWLLFLTSTIIWQKNAKTLYWEYQVAQGKTMPTAEFFAAYSSFLRLVVAWNMLYYTSLWAVKFSFLFFFRRLGSKIRSHQIWWWIVFSLTLAAWAACIGDIDYKCSLSDITYISTQCILPEAIKFQNLTIYGNVAADIVTDILILTIPFLILWNVHIPRSRKIMLFGLFSATIIIMVIAVIRVILIKATQIQIQNVSIDWFYLWANVEMGVAIMVACLASFRHLFVYNSEKTAQDSTQSLLRRLGFRKLSSSKGGLSKEDSGTGRSRWTGRPRKNSVPRSSHSEGQSDLLPLEAVRIKNTVDVSSTNAGLSEHERVNAQNRGYEFV